MKFFGFVLLLHLSFFPALAQPRTPKAVFVIVDGIPADVLEKVRTPQLDSLGKAGFYKRAYVGGQKGTYSQTPTISAVGYNSLLTGTWVNKHNVWGNDIKAPNYRYPTLFRLFKNQYPDRKTAVFSSWLDNRTKLVGDGLPQTDRLHVDYHADGYELDTVAFPHDREKTYMSRIDDRVVDEAVACLTQNGPDLSWVYLEFPDDMGHKFGDSPQLQAAVEKIDAQLGRLSRAIRARQRSFAEDWLLVITTDHGRDAKTGFNHGGQSERERTTWIISNKPELNAYGRQVQPGIVDLMPTIARHLRLRIPAEVAREIDGVPLTGPVSLADPQVTLESDSLHIRWTSFEPRGRVKIWLTTTNQFETGGKDAYHLLGEVPLSRQQAVFSVKDKPSAFYKIWLEGPANSVNRWVVLK
ncbi:alkaline phosphatase family protein [Tellurirhabdus rosea]|uniref:alkaline phosphatase family protein n=1 Tax=Tellurirhabdus rosea TaxID=2674997 RepID=UPI0022599950|nr:alkaline phosphatase family protein [Tellurirhabdus rosea]